jgi:hypothetical protein
VEDICLSFGLDALITQDYYSVEFIQYVAFNAQRNMSQEVISLVQDVHWTVYIPGVEKPLDKWHFHDTLYFVNNIKPQVEINRHTPLSIMREGGNEVGYSFGIRNVPVWNEISRIVYLGYDKELRLAAKRTNKGDWERAKIIWEQNLNAEDKRLAAKCAYNLAVYYELEDDIDTALQYALQAKEIWSPPVIEFYIQELGIRQQNKGDLARQMRFAD